MDINFLAKQYKTTATSVNVDYKSFSKSKSKQCFDNAYAYVINNPESSYVVGYVTVHGVPIEHAWIKSNEKYFDITFRPADENEYYSLFELSFDKLLEVCDKAGNAPGLYECVKFLK